MKKLHQIFLNTPGFYPSIITLTFLGFIFLLTLKLTSCKNNKYPKDPFDGISWETERLNTLHLISPLDNSGTDVYNHPLRPGQWYLMNKSKYCVLVPVSGDPEAVDFAGSSRIVVKVDTLPIGLLFGNGSHIGAQHHVHRARVALFLPEYKLNICTATTKPVAHAVKK